VRERSHWAFTGLLLFTALLYFRPQDAITPLAFIPLAEIAAVTALASMAFNRLSRGLPQSRVTPELIGVFALGGVILLTAPFSIWPGGAVATFLDLFVKVMLIFVLMVNTLTSPRRVERFTWIVVIAMSYIAFRAVFDYARGFNLIENGRVQGAVGGMFGNPNDLALNMVSTLPLAVLLAMRGRAVGRLAAMAGAFLMIGATIVSQSRSGFLGLAAMMLLLAVQIGRRAPGLIAAGAVALLLALPLVPGSYWERVSSITDESRDATGSRQARRVLLGEAWETFLTFPLTGVGAGNFKAYNPQGRTEAWRETHNVVLQVASELGIFGTAIFLYLVYRAAFASRQVKRLLRRAKDVVTPKEAAFLDAYRATMTAAVAGWFFSALFASVAYNWTFYYLLALAIAPREILLDRLAGRSVAEVSTATRAKYHKAAIPAEAVP
jgi:O-antigen ligase